MKENNTRFEFLKESMIDTILDEKLCDQFAGFESIVIKLCRSGSVIFPSTYEIENHLNKYPWTIDKGEYGDNLVKFEVDWGVFEESDIFKTLLKEEIDGLKKENRSMEKEIKVNEERITSLEAIIR